MSLGRQPYLGTRLAGAARHCNVVLVAGSEDTKFVKIAERMVSSTRQQQRSPDKQSLLTIVLIQHCGHAVHIDSPEAILRLLTLS